MAFVVLMDYYYLLPVGVSKWNDRGDKKRQHSAIVEAMFHNSVEHRWKNWTVSF